MLHVVCHPGGRREVPVVGREHPLPVPTNQPTNHPCAPTSPQSSTVGASPVALQPTYSRHLHVHGTQANGYSANGRHRARWMHSVRTPSQPPPDPLYGNRFKPLVDGEGGGVGGGGAKRPRTSKGT
eukprot:6532397-Prymnesium_polylepis.1